MTFRPAMWVWSRLNAPCSPATLGAPIRGPMQGALLPFQFSNMTPAPVYATAIDADPLDRRGSRPRTLDSSTTVLHHATDGCDIHATHSQQQMPSTIPRDRDGQSRLHRLVATKGGALTPDRSSRPQIPARRVTPDRLKQAKETATPGDGDCPTPARDLLQAFDDMEETEYRLCSMAVPKPLSEV